MMKLLASLLLLAACSAPQPGRIAKYDINEPLNGKYHGIIRIEDEEGGDCSAFVVSKDIALTSGHCMEVTSQFLKYGLKDKLKESEEKVRILKEEIQRIEASCFGPWCQMTKDAIQRQIQTELEAREKVLKMKPDEFKVFSSQGEDTGIKATAYWKHPKRDYGYIKGDFSKFNRLKVRHGYKSRPGDVLKICGFPGGKMPAYCIEYKVKGYKTFKIKGEALFQPGISGSPAIDHEGLVVGIAMSSGRHFQYLEPTMGILDGKIKKTRDNERDGQNK